MLNEPWWKKAEASGERAHFPHEHISLIFVGTKEEPELIQKTKCSVSFNQELACHVCAMLSYNFEFNLTWKHTKRVKHEMLNKFLWSSMNDETLNSAQERLLVARFSNHELESFHNYFRSLTWLRHELALFAILIITLRKLQNVFASVFNHVLLLWPLFTPLSSSLFYDSFLKNSEENFYHKQVLARCFPRRSMLDARWSMEFMLRRRSANKKMSSP